MKVSYELRGQMVIYWIQKTVRKGKTILVETE